MHRPFPGADTRHPLTLPDGTVHTGTVFLKNAIDHPRIDIGDYTYASAHVPPDDWAAQLAPYLYPGSPERLVIGRFCQIADGVTFITASANHRRDGFLDLPLRRVRRRVRGGATLAAADAGSGHRDRS